MPVSAAASGATPAVDRTKEAHRELRSVVISAAQARCSLVRKRAGLAKPLGRGSLGSSRGMAMERDPAGQVCRTGRTLDCHVVVVLVMVVLVLVVVMVVLVVLVLVLMFVVDITLGHCHEE